MRWVIAFVLFLLPTRLPAATVEPGAPRDYSKTLAKENVVFLRNLAILLEGKGFKDVRVIPQMFVAKAKKSDGSEITIIVDYNTLNVLSFEGELPLVDAAKQSLPETVLPQLR
jgi:hypothetical protein